MADSLPRISVDFNNANEQGLIFARHSRASERLAEGAEVLATDEEGHGCLARVERVIPEGVFLALAADTWSTPEDATPVRKTTVSVSPYRPLVVPGKVQGNGAGDEVDESSESANLIPAR
jgi:hypothetical protein